MAEYIEKQAAIDALGEEPEVWSTDNEWDMGAQEQWRFDHAAIEAIPPADVRPVRRGRWLTTDAFPHRVYCSICYKTYVPNDRWQIWVDGDLPRDFCPSCAADMRGGDADGDEKD